MNPEADMTFLQQLADIHRRSEKMTWRSSLREALETCASLTGASAAALLLLDNAGHILARLKYGEPRLAALEDLTPEEAEAWIQASSRRTLAPATRQDETLWLLAIPPHTRAPLGLMLFEGVRSLPPEVLKTGAALLTPMVRLAHEHLSSPATPEPSPADTGDHDAQWITRYNRLTLALQRLPHLTDPLETLTLLSDMMLQALDGNRIGILTIVMGRELFIHYRLGLTENSLRLMPGLYREALSHSDLPFQGIVQVVDLQQRPDELGALARLQDVHTLLLLPITIAEDEVGLIVICRDQIRPFSPAEMALGMTLASQTALVLQKGHLYQQEYAQRTLARSLSSAATALTQTLDLEQVLDLILDELARLIPSDASNVMLIEGGELRSVRWRGYETFGTEEAIRTTRLPLTLPNIVQMRETRAPLVIADVTQDPYWVPTEATRWLRSYAGAPIVIDQEMVGVISVDSARPNAFTLEDAWQLKAFADYAAIALRNARYYTQARQQARDLSLLHTLSQVFTQSTSVLESAQRCAQYVHQIFNATLTLITYPIERATTAQAVGWSGMPEITARTLAEVCAELEAELASQEVALLPSDLRERLPWPLPISAALRIPLINQNQKSGAMYLAWAQPYALTPEDLALYTAVGRQISTGLERLRLVDELQQRKTYLERLNAAISEINRAVGQEAIAEAGLREIMQVEGIEQGAVYLWVEGREWRLRLNKNARGELIPLPEAFPTPRSPQMSLPLSIGGEIAGVLNLYGRGLRSLRPDTEQLLHAIAYQLSLALQRGQLTDHLQEQLRATHALYELGAALLSLNTPDEVLWIALRTAYDMFDDVLAVGCYVPEAQGWKRARLYTAQKRREWSQLWPEGQPALAEEQTLLDTCARMKTPVRASEFELPQTCRKLQEVGARQVLYVPLALPQTHPGPTPLAGILALVFKQERDLLPHEMSQLGSLVQQTTAALERLALYTATRKAESRLRAILESSQDGLLLVGLDGRLHYINQAALRLLALPESQDRWEGHALSEIFCQMRRREPELTRWLLHKVQRNPVPGRDEPLEEGPEFTTADRRVLKVTRWGVFQDAQTLLGQVFYLRDMTSQKELEQMRDDLFHMLVHDLRNPLGVILNAAMMLRDPALKGMEEELIDITLYNTERTLRMVNTILDIGKLESGRTALERHPVRLVDLLDSIQKIVRVSTKTFAFELDFPPDLPNVWGEKAMIERVLQNLVDNALKFISGSPARLRIAASAREGEIQVEVFNTGKPIAPDVQPWLFEKFRPGKNEARGYGLGLAFCRLAVEAHGGRIWVENAPDGVSFKFTLPQAPGSLPQEGNDAHAAQDNQHADEDDAN